MTGHLLHKRVLVIGAGIGGLCAGVYLRRCGYPVEILKDTLWRADCVRVGRAANTPLRPAYTGSPVRARVVCSTTSGRSLSVERLQFCTPTEFTRLEITRGGISPCGAMSTD